MKRKKKLTDDPNYPYTLEPIPLAVMTLIAGVIILFVAWVLQEIAFRIAIGGHGIEFLVVGGILLLVTRRFLN